MFKSVLRKSRNKIRTVLVEDQLSPSFTCFCQIISISFSTSL